MFCPSSGRFFDFDQFRLTLHRGLDVAVIVSFISRCWLRNSALLSLVLVHGALAKQPVSVSSQLLQVPMHFEANQGQAAPPVEFLSRGPGYTLFLSPGEAVLSLRARKNGPG